MKYKLIIWLLFVIVVMPDKGLSQTVKDTLPHFINKETAHLENSIDKIERIISLSREYRSRKPELSYELGQVALSVSQEINYKPGIAAAYNRIGSYYRQTGSNYSAIYNYFRALETYRILNDTLGIIICYNGLGNTFMHQNLFDEALQKHKKAIELAAILPDSAGLAINNKNIAFIFLETKQFEEALNYAKEALDVALELDVPVLLPNFYQVLAQAYFFNNSIDTSIEYHHKAIELCKEINNYYYLSYSYKLLGEIYLTKENYSLAQEYFLKSLKIEKELGLILSLADIYHGLYTISKYTSDDKQALTYFKQYVVAKDEIFNTQTQNEISDLISYYTIKQEILALELLETENKILAAESEKKITLFNYVLISLAMILLLVIILWVFLKREAYLNSLLIEKNGEIYNQSNELVQKNAELEAQKEEIYSQNNTLEEGNKHLHAYIEELELLNLAARETDNAVIITDSKCNYIWVNYGFEKLFGYNLEEVKKRGGKLLSASNAENIEKIFQKCVSTKKPVLYESQEKIKSGDILFLRTTMTPVFDEAGRLKNLIIVESDISLLKQTKKELEKLNNTLKDKVKKETEKNRKKDVVLLQQSRPAAMGEMISNIGHQWRQPLNTIAVIIQNIQEVYSFNELTPEYMNDKMEKLLSTIEQMAQNLDEFGKYFKPAEEKHVFDLCKTTSNAVSFMESAFKEVNAEVRINIDKDVYIYGYSNEFTQVLINIIKNSRDAFADRKSLEPLVDISLVDHDYHKAVLCIADNAGGIEQDITSKVFDPFFSSKKKRGYVGLGLYMAKTLIEKNMNGKIWFENIDGGVKFFIECPSSQAMYV